MLFLRKDAATRPSSLMARSPSRYKRQLISFALTVLALQAACGPVKSDPESPRDTVGRRAEPSGTTAVSPTRQGDRLKLPVHFERNEGQMDPHVKFIARGAGPAMYLTGAEAVMTLPATSPTGYPGGRAGRRPPATPSRAESSEIRLRLEGANPAPAVRGLNKLRGKANYFLGADPRKWRTNVDAFGEVLYNDVYPGIDLKYHGAKDSFEYDFIVAPGADPRLIKMSFAGADRMYLNRRGDLVLKTASGQLRHRRPVVYQQSEGRKRVEGRYLIGQDGKVGFRLGNYDRRVPLIIDPVISYSTYLGGAGYDRGWDVAVDSFGHAYVTGMTNSGGFDEPADKRSDHTSGNGSSPCAIGADPDAFVVKLDPGKQGDDSFLNSAYLGGGGCDAGSAIALDGDRNIYISGVTEVLPDPAAEQATRSDFPQIRPAAPQQSCPENPAGSQGVIQFGFVAKLSQDASQLLYATCLQGSFDNAALNGAFASGSVAIDPSGNAYVAGRTEGNLPTTSNAYQKTYGGGDLDAFVAKLNPQGTDLLYSSYLGGTHNDSATALALRPGTGGSVAVTGRTFSSSGFPLENAYQPNLRGQGDAFVAEIDTNASGEVSLRYSTYLGGNECFPLECTTPESANGVAADEAGNIYVTGATASTTGSDQDHFPTRNAAQTRSNSPGSQDAYISKLDTTKPGDESLIYSSLLGGSGNDEAWGIAVDENQYAYVTGRTSSADFPSRRTFDSGISGNAGLSAAFLTKVAASGKYFVYSKSLGGELGSGIAVDRSSNVLVFGTTASATFPPPKNSYQSSFAGGFTDAFLLRVSPVLPAITNLSPSSGPVSGGTSVLIQGAGFPDLADVAESTRLGEDSLVVKFGGKRATDVTAVSPILLRAVSPPHEPATVPVTVTTFEGTSAAVAKGQFTYLAPSVPGVPPDEGNPAGQPADPAPESAIPPSGSSGLSSSSSASSVLPPSTGTGGQAPTGHAAGQGPPPSLPVSAPPAAFAPETVQSLQPSSLTLGSATHSAGVQDASVTAGPAAAGEQEGEVSPAPGYHMTKAHHELAVVLLGLPMALVFACLLASRRWEDAGRPAKRDPAFAWSGGASY